jgi:hypothetical protein
VPAPWLNQTCPCVESRRVHQVAPRGRPRLLRRSIGAQALKFAALSNSARIDSGARLGSGKPRRSPVGEEAVGCGVRDVITWSSVSCMLEPIDGAHDRRSLTGRPYGRGNWRARRQGWGERILPATSPPRGLSTRTPWVSGPGHVFRTRLTSFRSRGCGHQSIRCRAAQCQTGLRDTGGGQFASRPRRTWIVTVSSAAAVWGSDRATARPPEWAAAEAPDRATSAHWPHLEPTPPTLSLCFT